MTTVGRLAHYAAKCSIQIRPTVSVVGVTHEYQHRYAREITDGIALEPTQPVESWGGIMFQAFVTIGTVISALLFLANLPALYDLFRGL